MTTDEIHQRVADALHRAHESGEPIAPVRNDLPEGDIDAAYAVQRLNTERWLGAGRRLSGRKIGLTSKAVQSSSASASPTSACCSPT